MRFSEIYLILAEALGKAGGTTYLNSIRTRAGLPAISGALSESDYLEAVYKERRLEFGMEMHRWFDLVRHPDAGYFVRKMTSAGKGAQSYHKLLPIPQQERDKNPNLTQNTGY